MFNLDIDQNEALSLKVDECEKLTQKMDEMLTFIKQLQQFPKTSAEDEASELDDSDDGTPRKNRRVHFRETLECVPELPSKADEALISKPLTN